MIVGLRENVLVLTSKISGSFGLMLTHYKIVGGSMNNDNFRRDGHGIDITTRHAN